MIFTGAELKKSTRGKALAIVLLRWLVVGSTTLDREVVATQPKLGPALQAMGYEEVLLRRTAQNHLYVVGRVEGQRRSCLVDTGWSFTTVSTRVGRRLECSNQLMWVEWSGVRRDTIPARVADLHRQNAPAAFDLVLGADFLKQHGAVLDFARGRMYLQAVNGTNASLETRESLLAATGRTAVPLTFLNPPAWSLLAQVNGHQVRWLVDNGAVWSCLDTGLAQEAGLRPQPSHQRISSTTRREKLPVAVAWVAEWGEAGARLKGGNVAVFALRELGFGPDSALFSEVGGILGAAELIRNQAVLDCGTDSLWLRSASR